MGPTRRELLTATAAATITLGCSNKGTRMSGMVASSQSAATAVGVSILRAGGGGWRLAVAAAST
jgi:gamma-glutamyltranspeptidase